LVLGGGAAAQVAPALTIPHTLHDHLVLAGLALIAAEFSRAQPSPQHQARPGATP
jgi:type III pantothenate kinase